MKKFWVFLASCLVFCIAPWFILRQRVIMPETVMLGVWIAGGLLAAHVLIGCVIFIVSKKFNQRHYVWPILIPMLFWMIVAAVGVVYNGYIRVQLSKNYTIYQICDPHENGDFCACKMEYVYKNLPYLFDTQNQYQTMSVINEHVPDLEYGIRACRRKFGMEAPVKNRDE